MSNSEASTLIKEAKFVQALVENNGNASKAYKSIYPNVTDQSAGTGGYRLLKTVQKVNIPDVLKEIGATPKAVLGEALERAKKSKGSRDYLNTARFLAKLGNWGQERDLLSSFKEGIDTEVIDIVRVRLKKSRKEAPDIIEARADVAEASIVDTTTKTDTQTSK